jgi:outer membrane protein assembly factor BamB
LCGLFYFDHDGDVVWEHPLPVSHRFHGSDNSPILAGDRVSLNCEDTRDRYLLVLSAGTGEQWWKTTHDGGGQAFGGSTLSYVGEILDTGNPKTMTDS